MKLSLKGMALISAFMLAASPLWAQQTLEANSLSDSQSQSAAGAVSSIYLDQSSGGKTEIRRSGTTTLRTAPPVQAPSMGSGHPCGLGQSIGISVIGGGGAGGVTTVDEACLLAQMGQGEAALIMIAERDASACKALRTVERIPRNSLCTAAEKRAAAKAAKPTTRPKARAARPELVVDCQSNGGRITPVATRSVANAYTTAEIMDACR